MCSSDLDALLDLVGVGEDGGLLLTADAGRQRDHLLQHALVGGLELGLAALLFDQGLGGGGEGGDRAAHLGVDRQAGKGGDRGLDPVERRAQVGGGGGALGGEGEIAMGPHGLSKYYTWTRLQASGTVLVDVEARRVEGTAWMDHQWGDMQMLNGYDGWD